MLRQTVQDEICAFYNGALWQEFLGSIRMADGVRHAHLFMDSALAPATIAKITRGYFAGQGIGLRRSIWLTSEGPGYGNVYYIAPNDLCHFEIFLRYNEDVVLRPMPPGEAIGGKVIDLWDDAYMANFYKRFAFRPFDADAERQTRAFFDGAEWNELCHTMIFNGQRNKHCHCLVRMGVHPEEVARIGIEAMRSKGWRVDRAVSVTFRGDVGGQFTDSDNFEFAKVTFLVQQPETVLEIEWVFDPGVVIAPQRPALARLLTSDHIKSDLGSVPYYRLGEQDVAAVVSRITP